MESEKAKMLAGASYHANDPHLVIEPPFFRDCGYNVRIGARFYANHALIILDVMPVTIGDDVLIAPNVVISAAQHPLDPEARSRGLGSGRAAWSPPPGTPVR